MPSYQELRKSYPEFIYKNYKIEENSERVRLEFQFEIPGLSSFSPYWEFPRKKGDTASYNQNGTFHKMAFSLGMVELVSYWKLTCSPLVKVEASRLDQEQIQWWKDLYFNGLGEFYYTNGIEENIEDFMEIQSAGEETDYPDMPKTDAKGCLIPVGGGKDSAVTLSLLKESKPQNHCYIINPRGATLKTAERAGYGEDQIVAVKRTLHKNMLELNARGFLNGHTPYSAIVAFSSTIAAYMNGLHYIVLSNESSANESTVEGSTVNHQYSKSFRFEKAFHDYEKKYIQSNTYYFSMLRPLSEFQIARYFSRCRQFHDIFRSCNVGSKEDIWCGHCPKCLFVCLILSPFLEREEICTIFGCDMLNDGNMQKYFDQLIGLEKEKPFECVGSRDEINAAVLLTIEKLEKEKKELPLLLKHYQETGLYEKNYPYRNQFFTYYDESHLLPEEFLDILKKECY